MYRIFRNPVSLAAVIGVSTLTVLAGSAQAQDSDTFDVSVNTFAAISIDCGQNLSFGRVYVEAANSAATITLTSGGATSSNHASVAVNGGAVGQCTISGLQAPDTANVTLSGGGGTGVNGGLDDVELEDGSANTLLATLRVNGGVDAIGGKTGLADGLFAVFGTVAIPAALLDLGLYDATVTATVALD